MIVVLEKQIQSHRDNAVELIRQHEQLKAAFTLIIGIKGIAEASAVQILAELMILPSDMTAKQWVAHAGLDPGTLNQVAVWQRNHASVRQAINIFGKPCTCPPWWQPAMNPISKVITGI